MGKLFSKLWGKKGTKDVLEKIHSDIKKLTETKNNTMKREKRIMLFLSSVATLSWLGIILYWYLTRPDKWEAIVAITVALIMIPYSVFLLKKVLRWYYNRSVRKNEDRLNSLREKKKVIIDDLMETETFKVAKELLEKYDPEKLIRNPRAPQTPGPQKTSHSLQLSTVKPVSTPATRPIAAAVQSGTELRQRNVKAFDWTGNSKTPMETPHGVRFAAPITNNPFTARSPQNGVQSAPGPPLPKPLLPRNRTYLDRVMDYLVGDGPNNRYALICHDCDSHNGMALAEEFEYTAFRCCYCYSWNPSRKERPKAPKLETSQAESTIRDISDSEASTEDESDEEPPGARKSATEMVESSEEDKQSEEDENWKQKKTASSEKAEESMESPVNKALSFDTSSELDKSEADGQAHQSTEIPTENIDDLHMHSSVE